MSIDMTKYRDITTSVVVTSFTDSFESTINYTLENLYQQGYTELLKL